MAFDIRDADAAGGAGAAGKGAIFCAGFLPGLGYIKAALAQRESLEAAMDAQLGFAVRAWCAPVLGLPAHTPAREYFTHRTGHSIGVSVHGNGANMDNLVAGEPFRIRIKRDVANDNAVGNVQLLLVEIKET